MTTNKIRKSIKSILNQTIGSMICFIRGRRVMLDSDLAVLYGVETKVLNQAVRRNLKRFPDDFMFQLTPKEVDFLRSQIVTSNSSRGGRRYFPYAFTENGVAMLSSVLGSEKAIQVNIHIMRTFTKLREILKTHDDLRRKIESMEKKYDHRFVVVFKAIRELLEPPLKSKRRIGFHV